MKKNISFCLWALFVLWGMPGHAAPKMQPFPLADVRLLDSPFKHAEQTNLQYLLAMEPDRLLVPYRREAGLPLKATGNRPGSMATSAGTTSRPWR